ncbi:hypothetical protein QUB47_29380 [Microcoleus sp. AT9_B5]
MSIYFGGLILGDRAVLGAAIGASHICKNTSSGSFLLTLSSQPRASQQEGLKTPISSLTAFIEMLPVRSANFNLHPLK